MNLKKTTIQILNKLWDLGESRYLLQPKQRELRTFLLNTTSQIVVVNAHRQFGKSTASFQYADEMARKNPNWIIKIGAPTYKQVKDIIKVVNQTVLATCPKKKRPFFNKADGEFVYPNGSVIKMIGVDIGVERLRGTPSDLVILDEVGFMRDLDGLVYSVIMPTFNQRPHGRLIMTSTPPTVLAHDFSQQFIPLAKSQNAYWELPITRNPKFTDADIRRFAAVYDIVDAGGRVLTPGIETDKFKREYLCEIVPDTNRLVFPEWQLFKKKDEQGFEIHDFVKDEIERPSHYVPLVVGDWGLKDHTAILFGWVDFKSGKLVVQDEIWVNYTTPSDICVMIKEKVSKLFSGVAYDDIIWFADMDASLKAELRKQTGIPWMEKYGMVKNNKDGNITNLRANIVQHKLLVNSKCSNLILQLDKGVWKENRQDWERSELMGHCDALAALIYMNKVAPWNNNPFPAEVQKTPEFISPKHNYKTSQDNWGSAFGGKR